MAQGLTCMVTIHGIGFQQPPRAGQPGYADHLHQLLKARLGARLGDDPERWDGDQPTSLPVYVESSWRGVRADGLARLERPLVRTGASDLASIAHVALVYADLQEWGPRYGAALDALARSTLSLSHYANPFAAAHLLAVDLLAMLPHRAGSVTATEGPGLRPRQDIPGVAQPHSGLEHLLHRAPRETTGQLNVLQALADDVASYVCRNDLRERLRGFVQGALMRLAARDDVTTILLNTHSQGTVLGFDVLARYAPDKVGGLVTAGSPLRKYVDLFAWGDRVGQIRDLVGRAAEPKWQWLNFYDPRDPVADPLRGADWRPGDPPPAPDAATLFRVDTPDKPLSETTDCPVTDLRVDNVANSGGGLAAHNYWDNAQQVIPELASLLTQLAAAPTA